MSTAFLALLEGTAAELATVDPARILQRYPDLWLVQCTGGADQIATAALELIPTNLPVSVNGLEVAVPTGAFEPVTTPRAILRFFGPIAADFEARLIGLGAQVYFRCPRFGLCVTLPEPLDVPSLRAALPALAGWVPYTAELCARAPQTPGGQSVAAGRVMTDWADVVCFSSHERDAVALQLAADGVPVLAESRYKLRVRSDADLHALRDLPGVKLADGTRAAILATSELAAAVGIGGPTNGVIDVMAPAGLDGAGEVIAVADTGLDQGQPGTALHADFTGRVRALLSWPLNRSWDDYVHNPGADDGGADRASGHGTHVAGLALGDGGRSGGRYAGIAPAAELVFQAIEQYTEVRPEYRDQVASGFYLNGRPLDLRELFEQARGLGARIHVNAWGDPAEGRYTDDAFETDLFLWQHPDALVLFAAGNAGSAEGGGVTLDPASLYAPATAKGVLAIGATEGPRSGVGYRGTWSGFDASGRRFPNPDLAARCVSGAPQRIALFSSTGPTRDGRIKPDLCAPGTNLAAPKSQASAARGWGLASPLPLYMYNGGTSMAVGVAGGCAAVLRQAWTRALGAAPSGPALKALLIYAARPVLMADGVTAEPRWVAGFGRIDVGGALPDAPGTTGHGPPRLLDRVVDGLVTGQVLDIALVLAAGEAFCAVLAWYDYPGETLVNDLDLCLLDPAGQALWGNHEPGSPGRPDRANTVERIVLTPPVSGTYRLRVIAVNCPAGAQGFALVHSGGHSSPAPDPGTAPGSGPGAGPETGPGSGPGSTAAAPIPAGRIKGIGDAYARRLASAGCADLGALLAVPPGRLGEVLRIGTRSLAPIAARLAVLRDLAGSTEAKTLRTAPSDLSLQDVYKDRRPDGLEGAAWTALRGALEPLREVFDRAVRAEVRVQDLAGLITTTEEHPDA